MKILVLGDPRGTNISPIIEELNTKYGPFNCCLVLGTIGGILEFPVPVYTEGRHSIGDLSIGFGTTNVDIMVTSKWPKNIEFNSAVPLNTSLDCYDIDLTSYGCLYHFATGPFFEREPFINPLGRPTRFISLSPIDSGDRYYYAFETDGPQRNDWPQHPWLFLKESTHGKRLIDGQRDEPVSKRQQRPQRTCFLCLSNPDLEKYLIIHIGNSSYITLSKGPLTVAKPEWNLPVSGHLLIIPISHDSVRNLLKNVPETQEIRYNVQQIASYYRSVSFHAVCAQLSHNTISHPFVHILPVHSSIISASGIIQYFEKTARDAGFNPVSKANFPDHFNCFTLQVYDCESDHIHELFFAINRKWIDFQFFRVNMANILNIQERISWAKCADQAIETADVQNFRKLVLPKINLQ
ncbi:hypothetical protein CANCADRAFT_143296 [Tortispora caseinolytica NRRL Y-17796]|uniref:Cwf19-like C-terminal domain-containing protein n=1 Tax=Tortispora caseinolytica NRRL Y-17796 TaxID=767744 RepID=A0A1E4TDC3_9ASCO|nr:hypothetical protein CANCADRAFT_143296 [Tortispora caseinolytica NRRL Y-17796]